MINKIIYLTQLPLSQKELHSFGLKLYFRQGMNIEVWSGLSNFVAQGYADSGLVEIGLRKQSDVADSFDERTAIINLLPKNTKTVSLFSILNNSPSKVIEVRTNAVPTGSGRLRSRLRKLSPGRLLDFVIRQPQIWQKKAGIPGRIIYGGAIMRPAPGECGRVISAHALDYDVWLEFLAERGIAPEHARRGDFLAGKPGHIVFLDQYLPFHGDFAIQKRRAPVSPGSYFPALRRFFDRLEQKFGLPVVIAAHPRADYAQDGYSGPDYFGGRKLVSRQSLPLIFDSALALTHYSTAVNFAVMARKPLLLLSSEELERSEGHIIRSISAHLGAPLANIDRPEEPLTLKLNEPAGLNGGGYARYFHNYIKEDGSSEKPFWQILLDDMNRLPEV